MINLQLPNIKGINEREQLKEMQSYLYQLVEQLQFALNTVEGYQSESTPAKSQMPVRIIQTGGGVATMSLNRGLSEDQATFQAIKPLIIQSADIVNAYYEEINRRLESVYVAQSDFGTFAEKTSQEIEETSTDTTQRFENIQVVITDLDSKTISLENTLLSISEEFSYTQRDIVDINSNITVIGSDVENLSGSVSVLDGEIKTVEETVGAIDSELKEVEGNVGTLDTNLKAVESSIGTLDTEVKNVKTGVQNVTQEVSKVDTELQGVKTEVQTVTEEVGKVDTELQGVKTDVQGVATEVQGVATEVEGVKSSVGSNLQVIAEDIDKVESDLEGFKENTDTNIQGLNEGLGAVGNNLDSVDTELQGFKEDTSKDIEDIKSEIENIKYIIVDVNAYIKSGLLYNDANGLPVYGLEIGQRNTVNDVEIFNKFARFTSDRLSFYDQNDIEVAYISDKKLYISDVEVLRSFKIGGIKTIVLANGDVVKKWVGGES